ncbi:MAG: hypothetical protein K2X97_10895 [Mycobacteriaceae bacterium]|nr:hypothetical protein [Mycobacteriaceae bacterium]
MQNGNVKVCRGVVVALWAGAAITAGALPAVDSPSDATAEALPYVVFVQDFSGPCVSRNGVQILVKNSHPTRTIKVWLDRYHMGSGTGDRSRSELRPGAEAEPLGCSRTADGPQEWRVVRALFLD